MVGRVFAIMGEKHAERKLPLDQRTYKARVVFAGNNIQTSSGIPAHELFQEVSQAPAAMATVRCLLAAAALRGWAPKVRDAAQAYIQSRIDSSDRPSTWVRLPKSWWPASWHSKDGTAVFYDPVVRLCKALYGHPEAGALWDKHLRGILTKLGWSALESHPGFWTHGETCALLAVYVDDLLMAASPKDEARLWRELEDKVTFGDPPSIISKFLGGHHTVSVNNGVTTVAINMREFLLDAAERFREEIGVGHLAKVRTPYLDEDFAPKGSEKVGSLAKSASSHLMKVLFAARLCRPDLLVSITRLASKVSAWQECHDRALKRLFQYIFHHADLELVCSLGVSDLSDCRIVMSPDADLAGDMETSKSTSGLWVEVVSSDATRSWPISWKSKRQGSTASSTCEAEFIALSTALKSEVLPVIDLFRTALQRDVLLECLEDNTQCITAVETGYSSALRHLPRTERISLSFAHDVFQEPGCLIRHQESSLHKGDVFTKRLEPAKFEPAVSRLGLRRMSTTSSN